MKKEKLKPTYLMVPRKLVITWLSSTLAMVVLILALFQYINYVQRQSDQRWCGMVVMFDNNYKTSPPPSALGQNIAKEFTKLRSEFGCK